MDFYIDGKRFNETTASATYGTIRPVEDNAKYYEGSNSDFSKLPLDAPHGSKAALTGESGEIFMYTFDEVTKVWKAFG